MDHRRPWNALSRDRIPFILLLVIAALAAAGGARAQDDVLCICDNQQGLSGEGCIIVPAFVPTPIYLLLRSPSGTQVLSWEARVTHDNANVLIGTWIADGVDADLDPEDLVVNCSAAPLLPNQQDVVVLATMQVIVVNAYERIEFFIGPVSGSSAFPDGTPGYSHTAGIGTPATVCSGDYALPVFFIGMCLMDAVERSDWGTIKALYGR
ncbi:MAG: hypothetical protein IPM94_16575 [bacterium]|nr:hypothetical protein [bacterium]